MIISDNICNLDALKLEIAQIQFINTHYQTIIELCAEFKEILSVCIPFLTILQVIQPLMCALQHSARIVCCFVCEPKCKSTSHV